VEQPQPLLSVIVPNYNVEPYLPALFDSLSGLAGYPVELIFVEDRSTDGTLAKLKELIAASGLDSKLIVHEQNKGLSGARNTALKHARGEYVWFVDSDDAINPQELPGWFEVLLTHKPDLLLFDYVNFQLGEAVDWTHKHPVLMPADLIWRPAPRTTEPHRLHSAPHTVMIDALRNLRMHAWSYCFRRSMLPADPFPQGRVYEDLATIPMLLHAARTAYYLPAPLIYYRSRPDSITKFANARRDLDLAHAMQRDWDHVARDPSRFTQAEITAYLATWLKTLQWAINNLHSSGNINKPEVFAEYMENWKAYRRAAGSRHFAVMRALPRAGLASRLAAAVMTVSPRLLRYALSKWRPPKAPQADALPTGATTSTP
jgi:glycosyltransferase involved in cell wall biosynthesis